MTGGVRIIGWSEDPEGTTALDAYNVPEENVTLYAVWAVNQYTISFDSAGGSDVDAMILDYGADVIVPDEPARAGHTFVRWSQDLPAVMPAEDIAVTAVWTVKTHSGTPSEEELNDIVEDDEPTLQLRDDVADLELENALFRNLGGKPLTINVVDDEGALQYSWTFEGEYKEDAGTFRVSITSAEPDEDINGRISAANGKNPLVLNFAAAGELPVNAVVKYYVGDKYEDGTKLTLYFYNGTEIEEKAGDLEVIGGYVSFEIEHCSVYVLSESVPVSGDSSVMYIAIGAAAAVILAIAVVYIRRH